MKPQKEREAVVAVLFVISFGLLSKNQDRTHSLSVATEL